MHLYCIRGATPIYGRCNLSSRNHAFYITEVQLYLGWLRLLYNTDVIIITFRSDTSSCKEAHIYPPHPPYNIEGATSLREVAPPYNKGAIYIKQDAPFIYKRHSFYFRSCAIFYILLVLNSLLLLTLHILSTISQYNI